MKYKLAKTVAIGCVIFGISGLAVANEDYDDAVVAYEALYQNDYVAASKIWFKLANKGNPDAQFNLGFIYHFSACFSLKTPAAPL